MVIYSFEKQMSKTDKDISEYLKKRYEDYCRDTNEYDVNGENWYKNREREKHFNKQDQLVILGFELKKKLGFFLEESRKELFEQAFNDLKLTDSFFKDKYDNFCKELEETNNSLSLQNRKPSYQLDTEKLEKEKQLFEKKELRKDEYFVYRIDERRDKYIRDKLEYERTKPEREAKKKAEAERIARNVKKKGFSNVKPISFYEEMYIKDDSPFNYDDIDESKCYMQVEQEYDAYFEENGSPKGMWETYRVGGLNERKYWDGDNTISDRRPVEYTSADTPEENQKYLDRCKEIANMLFALRNSKSNQRDLHHIEILQKYLTKGYLITRQIADYMGLLNVMLIEGLSTDPNDPNKTLRNHPSRDYEIDIYSNDYDVIEIKEAINEFIRLNEGMVLTPIEYLRVFLKKHDNRITVVRYASIINQSYKVALRILKGFVADNKLKVKREAKGKLIFCI